MDIEGDTFEVVGSEVVTPQDPVKEFVGCGGYRLKNTILDAVIYILFLAGQ